jgi:hypothetical protein
LLDEIKKYWSNLVVIQEMQCHGQGTYDMKGYTMLYSGKVNGTHEFGVGFIVNIKIKDNIKDFKLINQRICAICIRTKCQNMWIINTHAPTEEKDGIKDDFYQTLEAIFD